MAVIKLSIKVDSKGQITKLKSFGNAMDSVKKSGTSLSSKLKVLSPRLAKITTPMGAAVAATVATTAAFVALSVVMKKSISAASEFQKGIAEVGTLMNKSVSEISGFGNEVKNIMAETGESTKDLTKGLFDIVSSGIDASKATKVLAVAADLATGGVTNVAVAVDGLTSVLNAYQLDAEQATNISDQLFTAQKFGKTTVEEISGSIGRLAPIMAATGTSTDEMFAALSRITLAGISTDEAVTSLTSVMNVLLDPMEDAKKAAKEMGVEIGASAFQNKGFTAVLEDVIKATDGSIEKIQALGITQRGLKGIITLTSDEGKKYTEILEGIRNGTGATNVAAEQMRETFSKQSDILGGKVKAIMIDMGEILLPLLTSGIKDFNKFLDNNKDALASFADNFTNILPNIINFALGITNAGISVLKFLDILDDRTKLEKLENTFESLRLKTGELIKEAKNIPGDGFKAYQQRILAAQKATNSAKEEIVSYILEINNQGLAFDSASADAEKLRKKLAEIDTEFKKQSGGTIVSPEALKSWENFQKARIFSNASALEKINIKEKEALAKFNDLIIAGKIKESDIRAAFDDKRFKLQEEDANIQAKLIVAELKRVQAAENAKFEILSEAANREAELINENELLKEEQRAEIRDKLISLREEDLVVELDNLIAKFEMEKELLETSEMSKREIFRATEDLKIELSDNTATAIEKNEKKILQNNINNNKKIIKNSDSLGKVLSAMWKNYELQSRSILEKIGDLSLKIFNDIGTGVGNAFAKAIVFGEDLGKSLKNLLKNVQATIISTLIKIGTETLIQGALVHSAKIAQYLGEAFAATYASIAAIPIIGPALAPAAAAGAVVAVAAGVKEVAMADGGIINQPTHILAGEAGREAIIPLTNQDKITKQNPLFVNMTNVNEINTKLQKISSIPEIESLTNIFNKLVQRFTTGLKPINEAIKGNFSFVKEIATATKNLIAKRALRISSGFDPKSSTITTYDSLIKDLKKDLKKHTLDVAESISNSLEALINELDNITNNIKSINLKIKNLLEEKETFKKTTLAQIINIEREFFTPQQLLAALQKDIQNLKDELVNLKGRERLNKLNELKNALINEFNQNKTVFAKGTPILLAAQEKTINELKSINIDGSKTFDEIINFEKSLIEIEKDQLDSLFGVRTVLGSQVILQNKTLEAITKLENAQRVDIQHPRSENTRFRHSHNDPNKDHIHAFSHGGIVDTPTNALIGEAGSEAVIPLNNNRAVPVEFTQDEQGEKSGTTIIINTTNLFANDINDIVDEINEDNRIRNNGDFSLFIEDQNNNFPGLIPA